MSEPSAGTEPATARGLDVLSAIEELIRRAQQEQESDGYNGGLPLRPDNGQVTNASNGSNGVSENGSDALPVAPSDLDEGEIDENAVQPQEQEPATRQLASSRSPPHDRPALQDTRETPKAPAAMTNSGTVPGAPVGPKASTSELPATGELRRLAFLQEWPAPKYTTVAAPTTSSHVDEPTMTLDVHEVHVSKKIRSSNTQAAMEELAIEAFRSLYGILWKPIDPKEYLTEHLFHNKDRNVLTELNNLAARKGPDCPNPKFNITHILPSRFLGELVFNGRVFKLDEFAASDKRAKQLLAAKAYRRNTGKEWNQRIKPSAKDVRPSGTGRPAESHRPSSSHSKTESDPPLNITYWFNKLTRLVDDPDVGIPIFTVQENRGTEKFFAKVVVGERSFHYESRTSACKAMREAMSAACYYYGKTKRERDAGNDSRTQQTASSYVPRQPPDTVQHSTPWVGLSAKSLLSSSLQQAYRCNYEWKDTTKPNPRGEPLHSSSLSWQGSGKSFGDPDKWYFTQNSAREAAAKAGLKFLEKTGVKILIKGGPIPSEIIRRVIHGREPEATPHEDRPRARTVRGQTAWPISSLQEPSRQSGRSQEHSRQIPVGHDAVVETGVSAPRADLYPSNAIASKGADYYAPGGFPGHGKGDYYSPNKNALPKNDFYPANPTATADGDFWRPQSVAGNKRTREHSPGESFRDAIKTFDASQMRQKENARAATVSAESLDRSKKLRLGYPERPLFFSMSNTYDSTRLQGDRRGEAEEYPMHDYRGSVGATGARPRSSSSAYAGSRRLTGAGFGANVEHVDGRYGF